MSERILKPPEPEPLSKKNKSTQIIHNERTTSTKTGSGLLHTPTSFLLP